MPTLYAPPDVHEAAAAWGANCGPGALAALTGNSLSALRAVLDGAGWPGYTNPTMAKALLRELGWELSRYEVPVRSGLAWMQFEGGWEANNRAAYKYTHWIAYRGWDGESGFELHAYDVNVGEAGGWLPYESWKIHVAPTLLPLKSTGWRIRKWIETAPVGEGLWPIESKGATFEGGSRCLIKTPESSVRWIPTTPASSVGSSRPASAKSRSSRPASS